MHNYISIGMTQFMKNLQREKSDYLAYSLKAVNKAKYANLMVMNTH